MIVLALLIWCALSVPLAVIVAAVLKRASHGAVVGQTSVAHLSGPVGHRLPAPSK